MRSYQPNPREFWNGYFDPETQTSVDGVVQRAKEAAVMRMMLVAVNPGEKPRNEMELVTEVVETAQMKAEDGYPKHKIEGLRGSHFTPEEAELIYVGLAMSALWDEMEITADGI